MTIVNIADAVFLHTEDPTINFSFLAAAEIKPAGLIRTFLLGHSVPVLVAQPSTRVPAYVESQLLGEHQRWQGNGGGLK